MKVIAIQEDNHGQIGIALNYYNAVKWLIDSGWISDDTDVCIENGPYCYEWRSVLQDLGENWADIMLKAWNIHTFNDYWRDSFHLDSETVIGTEEEAVKAAGLDEY